VAARRIERPLAGATVTEQGLASQAQLLPIALLAFGVTLPVFVWAGSYARNAAWMSTCFAGFAIGWGAFYAAVNWLKTPAAQDLRRRARVQILGGLIWAAVLGQLTLFAEGAGAVRETLLLLTLGGAMITVIFTAPWLPSLLVVAPLALAPPLIALFSRTQDLPIARLGLCATALALALALLVNRILRGQYALAAERETLIAERAQQAEAARRLARSKSDLIATLSDEIRNGLTGVAHVLAAAAGRGGRAAPSRQQLTAALDAVDDLLSVLNTTVDAETAEAGRLAVSPRPIDLAALAREVVQGHRPAAAAKGLEIALHVEPDLAAAAGAAVGDPARTRQVLSALVGNAVKFTVRGRVEARLGLAGERRIAVAVADTGPGLSEAELALAFQPFQRVARTSVGVGGAGLGLPLAAQLAGLMGGEVRAESAPGVGSCFTLELPFDPSLAAEAGASAPEPAAERRRLRILAVEPDALSAAMLRASLEQLGHQVVQASDPGRAVELARVCDLDLAVVAASMAGTDGAETVAALRALGGAAGRTPVVVLTGGDPEAAAGCLDAGADAVLRRPVAVPAAARAIAEAQAAKSPANDRAVA
jgi:two-component system, sensor histidine kinase